MIRSFDEVLKIAAERGPKTIAVACAEDAEVLMAVEAARQKGIAKAILVGNKEKIESICIDKKIPIENYEVIDMKDMAEASLKAVVLVSSGKADILMKGLVDTSILLKAVLNKEVGLRTGSVLSHVAIFEIKGYDRLFFITDAAMAIAPDLETKKKILLNAVMAAKALDIDVPNVAVVCAKEKVNSKMPCTLDAEALQKMNETGEISGCIVGGPFALDNAVSKKAADHKGVTHPGAGEADILLVPDIEAGNILYKALVFFAETKNAGILVGTKAPVVLTSRADSDETKLNSIAMGVLMAAKGNN
ncbi:MAG: phosphate butyryltransferase [Peptostreptococcaceae bacterium]|nr:phosphate butyryltransferase [Peptostreptococcaceae bacterium]